MGTASQTTEVAPRIRKVEPLSDWGMQHCILHGVSWEAYEQLVDDLENPHVFITYDRGIMEIISPSQPHGIDEALITRLLTAYADELDIPIRSCGVVTIKRRDLRRGLEPDRCFYVKSWREVATKPLVDFKVNPPDLAVEIEISRRLSNRREIYAALGIPEIWLDDGRSFRVLQLRKDHSYKEVKRSLNFPDLDLAEFERFLRMWPEKSEYELVREFRAWLRALKR